MVLSGADEGVPDTIAASIVLFDAPRPEAEFVIASMA